MNKREQEEHRSRNFWDQIHAQNLMFAMLHIPAPWRGDLMEAHLHLVWHFAHEENARLDFYASRPGLRESYEIHREILTGVSCNA